MNTKEKQYFLPAILAIIVGGVTAVGMLVQAKSPFLMDNTDGGYIEEGNWKTVRRIGYRKNERVGESADNMATRAQWTFTGIPRGSYDVFATWQVADSAKSEPDMEATFTIENGEKQLASISVNQGENSTGSRYKNVWWKKLGTWDVRNPKLMVRLSPSATSRSIFADAILLRRHKEHPVRAAPSVQVPAPLVSTGSRIVPSIPRPSTEARTTPSPATTGAASGNAPAVPSTPGASPMANSWPPSTLSPSSVGAPPPLTGTGAVSSASGSSVSSAVSSTACTDSDGGEMYDIRGTVRMPQFVGRDHCQNASDLNSKLVEYFCPPNDAMFSRNVTCPYGCDQGACEPQGGSSCVRISDEQTCGVSQRGGMQCVWNAAIGLCGNSGGSDTIQSCTDSDGGERYDMRGMLRMPQFGGNDNCSGDNLAEYFCTASGDMGARHITCPYGCDQGACKQRSGTGSGSTQ